MTTYLTFKTVTEPDFDGWCFLVEAGNLFDADDYAESYGISRHGIDPQCIHSVQDATGGLNPGEWLEVSHEAA